MAKQSDPQKRDSSTEQIKKRERKAESDLTEKVLYINRCSKVVKGRTKVQLFCINS